MSSRLPLQVIENMSETGTVFKLRVSVILLYLVSLGVTRAVAWQRINNSDERCCQFEFLIWRPEMGGVSISLSQGVPAPAPGLSLKEQSGCRNAFVLQVLLFVMRKTFFLLELILLS